NQLNFTFDGLRQAAESVQRLRNFQRRLESAQFPAGAREEMKQLADETIARMRTSLEDDLNTAQAQGAIFDMVRQVNSAADAGQVGKEDIPHLIKALDTFDEIFAVLNDDDDRKMARILDWAKAEGKSEQVSKEAIERATSGRVSDDEVHQKISKMEEARRRRDFKTSDSIRDELNRSGIAVEITKDGVRWHRK
ncbi:MAG: cysteine--tRNA ligase, partial [Acidobacteria bacterium]|nr:cysteine--tRNA ligase [Acidobacteriota bacterium]